MKKYVNLNLFTLENLNFLEIQQIILEEGLNNVLVKI